MKIINLKEKDAFLNEYIELCNSQWGTEKTEKEMNKYIKEKKKRILSDDKVISILGLINNNSLIGFVSLLKNDGPNRQDLTPWYATMYIKKEYRNKGYSKILNNAIIDEASKLGYNKIYLKTDLTNYYEKFGAIFMEQLKNKEKLYYFDLNKFQ